MIFAFSTYFFLLVGLLFQLLSPKYAPPFCLISVLLYVFSLAISIYFKYVLLKSWNQPRAVKQSKPRHPCILDIHSNAVFSILCPGYHIFPGNS